MSTIRSTKNVEIGFMKDDAMTLGKKSVTIAEIVEFMKLDVVADWTYFRFLDIKDFSVFKFHRLLYHVLRKVKEMTDADPKDAEDLDHRFVITHSSLGWVLSFNYCSWDKDDSHIECDDTYSMAVFLDRDTISTFLTDLVKAGAVLCDGYNDPYEIVSA